MGKSGGKNYACHPVHLIMQKKKRLSWWIRIPLVLAVAASIWLGIIGTQVLITASQSSASPADAAIVLGAAVYRDHPSPVYRERINHAIELYQQGQVDAIIFTGGLGSGDEISEGDAGREYALAAGVPDAAIFVENTSRNTVENLANSLPILEAQGFETVLLVSDPLHMYRAILTAEDLGLDAESSPTTTSRYRSLRTQTQFLFREIYFLAMYRILTGVIALV